nr:hypothetical protein CFP56_24038 [Quercus suber]
MDIELPGCAGCVALDDMLDGTATLVAKPSGPGPPQGESDVQEISNPPRRHDAACTCISPPGPMLVSTVASRLWPAGGRRGWRAPTLAEIRTQHGRHADGRGGGGMCKQIGPQLDFRGSVELDHRLGSTPDRRRIHYLASDRFTSYAVDCCPGSSHALRGDALGDVGGASHLLAQQGAMRASREERATSSAGASASLSRHLMDIELPGCAGCVALDDMLDGTATLVAKPSGPGPPQGESDVQEPASINASRPGARV